MHLALTAVMRKWLFVCAAQRMPARRCKADKGVTPLCSGHASCIAVQTMTQRIPATLIPGDGIGPEIVDATLAVFDTLGSPFE